MGQTKRKQEQDQKIKVKGVGIFGLVRPMISFKAKVMGIS